VIHAGAIGALAETMRAGKPMLILPIVSPDQPDNAFRARKLGICRTLSLRNYTPASVAAALLYEPRYADAAAAVGRRVRQEHGVATACEALESVLSSRGSPA
jgi:UDP:flavonoid glycosyltransferase YjiC (YdhE family)